MGCVIRAVSTRRRAHWRESRSIGPGSVTTPVRHPATVDRVTVSGSRVARVCAAGVLSLSLAVALSCGRQPAHSPPSTSTTASISTAASISTTATPAPTVTPEGDFAAVAPLMNDAIAAHRLPGAVVQIGHAGKVVFRQAFGSRKLADEPGLDGSPSAAEPMTEDTIFDLASLTKSVATAVAVLQLYEQRKVEIDEPLQTYLPDFNPANDPRRARVTLRMLLTHTSGIAGDLSLDGPWGLDPADKAEGIRRALAAWVVFEPGELFHYSDINFILLGALVEKITGQPLDIYIPANVFAPLGMSDTRYLPATKACGPHEIRVRRSRWVGTPCGPANALQVPGAPICWRASRRRRMTVTLRASTPTSAICSAAPCTTRRRAGWAGWPAVPVCSRRSTTSAGSPKHSWTALPGAPAPSRCGSRPWN